MNEQQNPEEFYKRLREQLEETTNWPSEYLYKFIVPNNSDKREAIEKIFDDTGAVITSKDSRNGKYVSLSINVILNGPDAVIAKYKEVGDLGGVISL